MGRNSNSSCLNQTQAINILLRLPVKSLAIISSRGFRNRHATTTRSLAPPRLLVSLGDVNGDKLTVFSYPNPEGDASVPYRDLSLLRTKYKVLAIDIVPWRLEHKIVVMGGGSWKETSCALCMKGFIYYGATRKDVDYPDNPSVLVCFDVRLEKFSIINVPVPVPGSAPCLDLNVMGFVSDGELCLVPSEFDQSGKKQHKSQDSRTASSQADKTSPTLFYFGFGSFRESFIFLDT